MSSQKANIEAEAKEQEDSIFDKYYNLIEKYRLQSLDEDEENVVLLANSITIVERNLIDLSYNRLITPDYRNILNHELENCLKKWFPLLNEFIYHPEFVLALAYNFIGLSLLTNAPYSKSLLEIQTLAAYLSPTVNLPIEDEDYELRSTSYSTRAVYSAGYKKSKKTKRKSYKPINIFSKIYALLELAAFRITLDEIRNDTLLDDVRSKYKALDVGELLEEFKLSQDSFEEGWQVTIRTSEDLPEATEFLSILYTLLAAIKSINSSEIDITLTDWGNGSKWATFWVKFKNFLVKEETKEVLEKARKAAIAELFDKRIGEAEKLTAETAKVARETENLPDKVDAQEATQLDLELKRLSVIEKTIEIKGKALDLRVREIEAFNKISDVIKTNLLKDSNLQMEINNLFYFDQDNPAAGNDINLLDARNATRFKDDNDELHEQV